MPCPQCRLEMPEIGGRSDERFRCVGCRRDYRRLALCPECGLSLQVLKACGAIDYFCPQGHGLISKKRVLFRYQPVGPDGETPEQ
nr:MULTISPECIES: zinc ribbon domain-containing protein [Lonsdalea]